MSTYINKLPAWFWHEEKKIYKRKLCKNALGQAVRLLLKFTFAINIFLCAFQTGLYRKITTHTSTSQNMESKISPFFFERKISLLQIHKSVTVQKTCTSPACFNLFGFLINIYSRIVVRFNYFELFSLLVWGEWMAVHIVTLVKGGGGGGGVGGVGESGLWTHYIGNDRDERECVSQLPCPC